MGMADSRIEVPDEDKTLRTKLVDAIVSTLLEAKFKPNDEFNDTALFDFGGGGTLDDIAAHQTPAFTIEEGDEASDSKMYGVIDKTLRVYVHFKVVFAEGIDAAPMINYYFGRIVQVLVTPEHFGDIAFDIEEAGNSMQYQGLSDPEPGGTVMFDVEYRHGRGNQFSEEPNT
jgi:hypothetical protein